jgi:hypothetical protein
MVYGARVGCHGQSDGGGVIRAAAVDGGVTL